MEGAVTLHLAVNGTRASRWGGQCREEQSWVVHGPPLLSVGWDTSGEGVPRSSSHQENAAPSFQTVDE